MLQVVRGPWSGLKRVAFMDPQSVAECLARAEFRSAVRHGCDDAHGGEALTAGYAQLVPCMCTLSLALPLPSTVGQGFY